MSSRKDALVGRVTQTVVEHSTVNLDGDAVERSVRVPETLQGRLVEARRQQAEAAASLGMTDDSPFAFSSIVARNKVPGKDLRTGADLVSDLTSDLADVKTVGEARAAAETIRQRFGRTGVYRDVRVLTEDSASGRGVDLVVELDESTLRAEQGVTRSGNGAISTSTNVALSNIMGWGEQWSLNLGASAGEGALNAEPGANFMQRSAGLQQSLAPRVQLGFSKPTFFGTMAPFGVNLQSETQRFETTLGFSKKVSEVELHVSDPSNRHSLSYSFASRDVVPIPHPTSDFLTASAPHVVANNATSIKSAIRYSYANSRLKTHPQCSASVPAGGYRFNADVEVAGPGGEAHFVKGEAAFTTGFSLWRYMPDTGYSKPLAKGEFVEREATLASGGAAAEVLLMNEARDRSADSSLKAHPGTKVFCPTMMFGLKTSNKKATAVDMSGKECPAHRKPVATASSSSSFSSPRAPKPYTFGQRMAGWLSPGFTFLLDGSFGALRSYGPDSVAAKAAGSAAAAKQAADASQTGPATATAAGDASLAAAAASASTSAADREAVLPRLADRFFLTGVRMRGFEAVGPHAPRVPHGSPYGDAIGGDVYGAFTARLLMPPPLPSVRLANYGVRTQLWATAGKVGSLEGMLAGGPKSLFNPELLQNPSKIAKRALAGSRTWSASAGVGLSAAVPGLPLAIELNIPLWHSVQTDDTRTPKGTLRVFWAS